VDLARNARKDYRAMRDATFSRSSPTASPRMRTTFRVAERRVVCVQIN